MSQRNHSSLVPPLQQQQQQQTHQQLNQQQRSGGMLCSFGKFIQRLLIRRSIIKTVLLACLLLGSFYANLQSSTTNASWNNYQDYYLYSLMPTITAGGTKNVTANSNYFYNQLYPVRYVPEPPKPSFVHCVGESYDQHVKNSSGLDFVHRSCVYQNICINLSAATSSKGTHPEFILIVADHHRHLNNNNNNNKKNNNNSNITWSHVHRPVNATDVLSIVEDWKYQYFHYNKSVALSALAAGWSLDDKKRVAWSPRTVTWNELAQQGVMGYYQLDPSVTLVPFVWHGAANPGHVVWDNLLPMYKLLTMFGLWPSETRQARDDNDTANITLASPLLFVNMPVKRYLFGACSRSGEKLPCQTMMEKLLPLLGLSSNNLMHLQNRQHASLGTTTATTKTLQASTPQSTLVCASQAVAGLGLLSDHGWKEHGQYHYLDYSSVHNVGKSDLVYQFRNMVLRNMGIEESPIISMSPPYRITMVVNSTKNKERVLTFQRQQQAMEVAFSSDMVSMERHVMQELSLVDQLQIASRSFIYMSACGGSVVTATFLPRGASLILFYPSHRKGRRHSKLDYDFLNNLAYIRVHWIPILFMNEPGELELLVLLIQSELDRVAAMRRDQIQEEEEEEKE